MDDSPSIYTAWLRKAAAQLPYLPRTLALVWEASSGWTTAWAILLVLQGLLPAATVYLTRTVVDRAVPLFRTHGDPAALRAALPPPLVRLRETAH